ncbi:hypothetical protein R1sor_016362 [Riccia sorocarpa]|uniref:Mitochondrial import inner membrane translocase subunit TIM50 n=1 Tax=Riccia sorocarpa TaxID=122646 RepID=A0ABD3HF87_9MARC
MIRMMRVLTLSYLPAYQFKCVRDGMCQVKKHLEVPNNSRLRETFVGQVLTYLLIHLGIYKGRHGPSRPCAGAARRAPGLRACDPTEGRKGPARPYAGAAGRAQGLAVLQRAAKDPGGPVPEPQPFAALLGAACLQRLWKEPLLTLRLPPLRRPDGLEPEMQQKLLHAIQTEDRMDVRLNAKKAELAELERLVALEERLLEETARGRKEEEHRLETLGANVYQPHLVDPRSVRRKALILALDGLLVSIRTSAEEHSEASQNGWEDLEVKKGCFVVARIGLSEFLEACLREFHLMIWTSRKRAVIDRIIRFLFKSKKISVDLAHLKSRIWSREQCLDLGGKTSRPLYYKDFDMLYEHNISAHDLLIVEDEVVKISTNNSTVNFVEETRPWDILPWAEEPMEALVKWWGPDARKGKTWTDVLFRNCTYEERKSLRQIWTGITVRQKSRVESSPCVEGAAPVESTPRVEGADPVESAAPVESTTPDLSAAPIAIDQTSAPISSVVDVAPVPSTS